MSKRYSFARDVKHSDVPGQKPQFRDDREHTPERPTMRQKRSVWSFATQPFPEAHFATASMDWIREPIMAGTPQRGSCTRCRSPFTRVTRKTTAFGSGSGRAGRPPAGKYAGTEQAESGEYDLRMGPLVTLVTLGWRPTCRCHDKLGKWPKLPARISKTACDEAKALHKAAVAKVWEQRLELLAKYKDIKTVPAVVLDPFGGAGTTAVVAEELQRNCILIELNPAYARMARKRIREHLGRVESDIPEDKADDLPLFGASSLCRPENVEAQKEFNGLLRVLVDTEVA